ncbi:hypothetical protein [Paraburkholderia graminis]
MTGEAQEGLRAITDMGYDFAYSIEDIDNFVDMLIAELNSRTSCTKEHKLRALFLIEDARQKALLNKYCTTVQPL